MRLILSSCSTGVVGLNVGREEPLVLQVMQLSRLVLCEAWGVPPAPPPPRREGSHKV